MTTIGENFRDKVDTLVAEYIEELKEENETLKDNVEYLHSCLDDRDKSIELLKEFKEKREESMFYFKALMERAEPKTAKESEDLQKAKDIFEKLYNEKLDSLEEENRKLKLHIEAKDKAYTALLRDYEELKLESKK